MGNGYNDPYSPVQTGAAFLSGVQRSYNNNLAKQADLMMFKHQMRRQKTQDAYVTEQRQNARFDRNLRFETGAINAERAGNADLASVLRSGMSGNIFRKQQEPISSLQTEIPTPRMDVLGSAGVSAASPTVDTKKLPMRIGGTARTYDDTGREYVSSGDKNYPVTTKKDEFGTSVRSVDTSRIIPTKQEYDFTTGKKPTPVQSAQIVKEGTSSLRNRLSRDDVPQEVTISAISETIESLRDIYGTNIIPGYKEADLNKRKTMIPDSYNMEIVNEINDAIDKSGMTDEQKDVAYDALDATGYTDPESVIDREVSKHLETEGFMVEARDVFGKRFPESVLDEASRSSNISAYQSFKDKGLVNDKGEIVDQKLQNMVDGVIAGTRNPEKLIESAAGPEGVMGIDGERLPVEEAIKSAQVRYTIKKRILMKIDEARGKDESDGIIGPVIGGTYRTGKKLLKSHIKKGVKREKKTGRTIFQWGTDKRLPTGSYKL